MRTIATLQAPDTGQITFEGIDILADKNYMRQRLGYLPQEFGVYPRASAEDLMHYLASLKGVKKGPARNKLIADLLELVNLTDHKQKAVASYSGGMKQRFGIAQSLINDPSLIIVDEPTAGLDPAERIRFLNIISEVGKEKTVILSTHIVEDVANLCERFCIIKKGQVVAVTTPQEALAEIDAKIYLRPSQSLESKHSEAVLTEKFIMGQKFESVFCDAQVNDQYKPVTASLEDFYLYKMQQGAN